MIKFQVDTEASMTQGRVATYHPKNEDTSFDSAYHIQSHDRRCTRRVEMNCVVSDL